MKIAEIMTSEVGTCTRTEGVHVAAGLMKEYECGIVPVLDDRRVVGVITDRDICMAALATGKPLEEIQVESAMTRDVLTCSPDDPIERAEETMRAGHVRRLPVTQDGRGLVGMVSLDDIALAVVRVEDKELLRGTADQAGLARTLAAILRRRVIVDV